MNRILTAKTWTRLALPALAAAIVFAVFLPALDNGFLDWDDSFGLLANRDYRGLGWQQLRWMFTTFGLGPYTPLNWLTLGFDHLLWGLNPFGYHLTNAVLHALNSLVFYFLCRSLLTLAAGNSAADKGTEIPLSAAFAALFFALHPLRVESVAWISGRHDILSCLFYLLAVLWYIAPRAEGREKYSFRNRLLPPLAAFLLALLSKGMAISLPVVLVVLDIYPLKRLPAGSGKWFSPEARRVWLEKLPFFVLALIFGAVGYAGQAKVGALGSYQDFGFGARVSQMVFGAAFYVRKTLAPLDLSPFYRLPGEGGLLNWRILLAGTAIAALTVAALALRRRRPAFLAVWACYLAMLAPVSGIVKINAYAAADRYAYLSCLGFAVLAGAGFLSCRQAAGGRFKTICLAAACLVLSVLGLLSWRQEKVWRDTETLWRQAITADPGCDYAQTRLGFVLEKQGKTDQAILHYKEALRLDPRNAQANVYLGHALSSQGSSDKAAGHYLKAAQLRPDDANIEHSGILAAQGRLDEALDSGLAALKSDPGDAREHNNLGFVLAAQGRTDEAVGHYREALKLAPGFAQAHNNLAIALNEQDRLEEAIAHYLEAVRLKPDYAEAYYNLGQNLAARGRFGEAAGHYRTALRITPGLVEAHSNLGTALSALGRPDEAVAEYREALRLRPGFAVAHYSLGAVLHKQGKLDEAGRQYEAALKIDPEYAQAHYNLSFVLYNQGRKEQALEHYNRALQLDPSLRAAAQGGRLK